jgi:precorrin-6Y C5,15-methyltransferase (decarboxylating) CbiT subunit
MDRSNKDSAVVPGPYGPRWPRSPSLQNERLLGVESDDPARKLNLGESFFNAPGCSLAVRPRAREICLNALGVRPGDIVWDIGAGTGSVSLVSALRHREARYYALEQSVTPFRTLCRNVRRLGRTNVIPCFGRAPEDLPLLPRPDRVYLGGTGGRTRSIVPALRDRLIPDGCFVASFLREEHVAIGRTYFDRTRFRVHSFSIRFDRRKTSQETAEEIYFLVASGRKRRRFRRNVSYN